MSSSSDQTIENAVGSHDLAIVRALQAILEDAVNRSDYATARDLAEQLEQEMRRQGARCSPR